MKTEAIKLYEIKIIGKKLNDNYYMVIRATHRPKPVELQDFLKEDIEMYDGTTAVCLGEISQEDAENFFDMSEQEDFPVLS